MQEMLDRDTGAACDPHSVVHVGIRNLVKTYGSFTALAGITLEIARGELVCFLGPSGCGKTTLLRTIAGLDRQDSGAILLGGKDVSQLPPAQRDFGIVFQSYALFPNLRVSQNVGYGLVNKRQSKKKIAERVKELLDLVGLPDQGSKYPIQLSGGQQQRVALARALATSPSLLLLDEPLSALDARVRVNLRDEIKLLQRRLGITTILVTHDQEEALTMADRIVVMNHGVIEQVGTPEDVYTRPASPFVAQFVGTMNFLDAVVSGPNTVASGSLQLVCSKPLDWPTGTPIRLGLRPEEVRVRDIRSDSQNKFSARIILLDFLGAFCRASLELVERPEIRLVADFSANAIRDLGIQPGANLEIVLPPEAIRVFGTATRPST